MAEDKSKQHEILTCHPLFLRGRMLHLWVMPIHELAPMEQHVLTGRSLDRAMYRLRHQVMSRESKARKRHRLTPKEQYMKLQEQVITIEQAKRLKELGIDGNSYFLIGLTGPIVEHWSVEGTEDTFYSAYTVAELGQMLPDYYLSWRFSSPKDGSRVWLATVICGPKPPGADDIHTAPEFDRFGPTQAQALATLLIALLETETISPAEVNARLKT
jgi:hypothetical protein